MLYLMPCALSIMHSPYMYNFHIKDIKDFYPESDASQLFLIPVIRRCREFVEGNATAVDFEFRAVNIENINDDTMRVRWDGTEKIPEYSSPEEKTVTEHAALGVAHLIFPGIIEQSIGERTDIGSGCDYWLGDERETLLEVSGIYNRYEKPETRIGTKIKNLDKSPFYNGRLDSVDCYISVTHFNRKQSYVHYIAGRSDE